MLKILGLLIAAVLLITGSASAKARLKNIEIYTFQKDRVDQEISGNRGYITGKAPETTKARKVKRTLNGIDIGVPGFGSDKQEEEVAPYVKKTPNSSGQKTVLPSKKAKDVNSKEEWIK